MATNRKRISGETKKGNRRSSARRNNPFPIWLGVALAAGLIVVVALIAANLSRAPVGEIAGVQAYPNLDRSHTDGTVNYSQVPPVGGQHNPVPQNCGVYTQPVTNENAVHSLEHGAIWITYQPDLPADQLKTLQDITRQSAFRLLSPYPGISSPIVVTAWGYQLHLDNATDPRLKQFIQKYEQKGPEPGATCSGGMGNPG
ncbi:MAG TPA: DUF3105 domain-containing protein [Anaerolineaceae bacterium]|nr:DUF3105 domain-containing protein [Anaerolineaceae bacterium]